MPDTEVRRTINDGGVSVDITCSRYGTLSARLTAWREKPRGGSENIIIDFEDLSAGSLACIGRSAIQALREKRKADSARTKESIEYATGWNEGEGPG